MPGMELFSSRTPDRGSQLDVTELKKELSLPPGATERETREKFFDFINRASARFEGSAVNHLSPAEADLPRMWLEFKGKLRNIDQGVDSLFPPGVSAVSGRERAELAQLFGAVEGLEPVTEATKRSRTYILEEMRKHDLNVSPDEHRLWFGASVQVRRFESGQPAFIAPAVAEILRTLTARADALKGAPNEIREGMQIGETNLIWRNIGGDFEPCFRDGRYVNSSILISTRYLRICLDRIEGDDLGARQQRRILTGALAVLESGEGRIDFVRRLREEFGPQSPATR